MSPFAKASDVELALSRKAEIWKVDAELSAVAHAALTALASRSADAFRASVANFSTETRSRMEVAVREEQPGEGQED